MSQPSAPPPTPGMTPPPNHIPHFVYWIAAVDLVVVFLIAGFAFDVQSKLDDANKQVTDLEREISRLEEDLDDREEVENDLETTQEYLEDTEAMAGYMAEKFDELDTILLDTDTNCVDFIAWVYDNASFENLPEAQARYDAWGREQDRTNEAYSALNDELDLYFGDLGVEYDTQVQ